MATRFLPNSDQIYQEFKTFIEGVEVPFESFSVTSPEDGYPTALISIPPLPGLSSIAQYYSPKVHIFFREMSVDEDSEASYKLLFTGIVQSVSYNKSKGLSSGASISFSCVHKNAPIDDITMSFGGRGIEGMNQLVTTDAVATPGYTSSAMAMMLALRGITTDATFSNSDGQQTTTIVPSEGVGAPETTTIDLPDTSYIPPSFGAGAYNRLKGIPGVFVNLWNQLREDANRLKAASFDRSEILLDMYIPLVESGLKFWQRASGHPLIESGVEETRVSPPDEVGEWANAIGNKEIRDRFVKPLVTPPAFKVYIGDAVATYLAQIIAESSTQYSGENTSFVAIMDQLLGMMFYDRTTLASPAAVPNGAVETIFKPRLDFYYSPACNVLYPSLYDSISVTDSTYTVPSRVLAANYIGQFMAADTPPFVYRAPQSVREAIAAATGGTLADTKLMSYDKVGLYEWSRGVKPMSQQLPEWLMYLVNGISSATSAPGEAPAAIAKTWAKRFRNRHGEAYPDSLNPYSSASGLTPAEIAIVAVADSIFASDVANHRSGSVSGVFNPYIVPGYSMDILAKDATSPSYHATCASVTHSVTGAGSIGTSVVFRACVTMEELYSYYLPAISPWLYEQLGLTGSLNIVHDEGEGLQKAHEYFIPVLGVGAVAPADIYNFQKGYANPVTVKNGFVTAVAPTQSASVDNISVPNQVTGSEENPNLSVTGALALIRRPIESMSSYSSMFGVNFIQISDDLVNHYYPTTIQTHAGIATGPDNLFEPGRSMYLDYGVDKATLEKEAINSKLFKQGQAIKSISEGTIGDVPIEGVGP